MEYTQKKFDTVKQLCALLPHTSLAYALYLLEQNAGINVHLQTGTVEFKLQWSAGFPSRMINEAYLTSNHSLTLEIISLLDPSPALVKRIEIQSDLRAAYHQISMQLLKALYFDWQSTHPQFAFATVQERYNNLVQAIHSPPGLSLASQLEKFLEYNVTVLTRPVWKTVVTARLGDQQHSLKLGLNSLCGTRLFCDNTLLNIALGPVEWRHAKPLLTDQCYKQRFLKIVSAGTLAWQKRIFTLALIIQQSPVLNSGILYLGWNTGFRSTTTLGQQITGKFRVFI